jgi:hypothetical protein
MKPVTQNWWRDGVLYQIYPGRSLTETRTASVIFLV